MLEELKHDAALHYFINVAAGNHRNQLWKSAAGSSVLDKVQQPFRVSETKDEDD